MFGMTTSQAIAAITILVSIVLYFAANTGSQQNAFIFLLAIALLMLIVGTPFSYTDVMFMNNKSFEYEPHYENWQKNQ